MQRNRRRTNINNPVEKFPQSIITVSNQKLSVVIDEKNEDYYVYNAKDQILSVWSGSNLVSVQGVTVQESTPIFTDLSSTLKGPKIATALQLTYSNFKGLEIISGDNEQKLVQVKGNIVSLTKALLDQFSFNKTNELTITFQKNPISLIFKPVHNILNLQRDQIKLSLDEAAFIIKQRSQQPVIRKAGKPKEIAVTKTIGISTPKPKITVTEPVKPKIPQEKPVEGQGINLTFPDDGFNRVPCHNFVVSENSRGQFQKNLEFFQRYSENYDWKGPVPNPYRNILITPVSLPRSRKFLNYLRSLKERGIVEHVMFDSGGFQVMTGSLKNVSSLKDLLEVDRQIYTEENWADIYILPDHPPVGEDSFEDAENKIVNTVEACLEFADRLPADVKARSVPVFHAKYLEQIDYFYEAYKPLIDISKMATYSAAGKTYKDKPRQLNTEILRILQELVRKLGDAKVHCLGIASPPAVFCLAYLGVRTYDSSTATKVAATGKVLFPYTTAKSCSIRRPEESLTEEQLESLRESTGHSCPFCDDIEFLKQSTDARRLHNLIVLDELNWHYRDLDIDLLAKHSSSNYRNSYVNRLADIGLHSASQNQLAFN